MTYLLALIAATLWGTADFVQGKASRVASAFAITFWSTVIWVVTSLVVLAVMGTSFDAADFAWGLAGGTACAVGMPLFAFSLGRGQMSVIAPVAATTTALLPVVVGLVAGEHPRFMQLVGALIAIVAIALISMSSGERTTSRFRHAARADVVMGSVCGACFALYFIAIHQTSSKSGIWPNFGVELAMLLLIPLFARLMRTSLRLARPVWKLAGAGSACDWFASLGFLYATRDGLLSLVAVVSSLYPVATVLLAWAILRERIQRLHATSLALAVVGVGLIMGA